MSRAELARAEFHMTMMLASEELDRVDERMTMGHGCECCGVQWEPIVGSNGAHQLMHKNYCTYWRALNAWRALDMGETSQVKRNLNALHRFLDRNLAVDASNPPSTTNRAFKREMIG